MPTARSRTRRGNRPRSGFTLVELLITIIIIGMIGGAVMMSWQALLPSQELHTAIRNLAEVLHETRSQAIAYNREFRLYYDLDRESYAIRTPFLAGGGLATADDDDRRMWGEQALLEDSGVAIESVTIDDEVYRDGTVFVRFDPLGASSNHTVVLRSTLFDNVYTIEVLPLTGEMRFHEGYFERRPAEDRDFD